MHRAERAQLCHNWPDTRCDTRGYRHARASYGPPQATLKRPERLTGWEPSAPVPARLQPPPRRPSRPLAAANAADQAVRTAMAHARKQIGSLDGIGVSWRYRHAM